MSSSNKHKHSKDDDSAGIKDKEDALVLWFDSINNDDTNLVGGKNASLGEMYHQLSKKGIKIPNGFAVTAKAYNYFLDKAGIRDDIKKALDELHKEYQDLKKVGKKIRNLVMEAEFPEDLSQAIIDAYEKLKEEYKEEGGDVAVRSSATAEDLPDASFAGQQESYLNIEGKKQLLDSTKKCMASLFTDRAISYREDKKFEHFKVSLSVGIMKMVRSDKAAAGTMFTIDTETGFKDIVLVNGSWGLGENVVQGSVNPDEFAVFKPTLSKGYKAIVNKTLGSKEKFMVYSSKSGSSTKNLETEVKQREQFCLSDKEVLQLAEWGVVIEQHYSEKKGKYVPMDIEWAKDGVSGELYIVQARPETVQSRKNTNQLIIYKLKGKKEEAEEFKKEHEEEEDSEQDKEVKKDLGKVEEKTGKKLDKDKKQADEGESEVRDDNKDKKEKEKETDKPHTIKEKTKDKEATDKTEKIEKNKTKDKDKTDKPKHKEKADKTKDKEIKQKGNDKDQGKPKEKGVDIAKMVEKRRKECHKEEEDDEGEDKEEDSSTKSREEEVLTSGAAVGNSIAVGAACIIPSINELVEFRKGEILVTEMTDPDWEPILKHAAAIVTNSGGRTCHAAIIARELGIPCIVGCGDATSSIDNKQGITVDCARGERGVVLSGIYDFEVEERDLGDKTETRTKIMMNVADPERAFGLSFIPNQGVGLGRVEFIINNHIGIHPLALLHPETLSKEDKKEVKKRTKGYKDNREFFISKLAQGIACIAAAFYPKPVIIRFSDFKTNEYANLLGGKCFEPKEDNPMLGWRGASRYYDPNYRDGFKMECEAVCRVRNVFGLENLQVMIPMIRTIDEAKRVLKELENNGIRQSDGIQILGMCEVPANCIMAEEFLELLDGFSIGSNDLTQMSLGVDRDSQIINDLFDERNETVKRLISMAIKACNDKNKYCGICGQAPSDYPSFAEWLVEQGIQSMSLNSDTVIKTTMVVAKKEEELGIKPNKGKKDKEKDKKEQKEPKEQKEEEKDEKERKKRRKESEGEFEESEEKEKKRSKAKKQSGKEEEKTKVESDSESKKEKKETGKKGRKSGTKMEDKPKKKTKTAP